MKTNDTCNQEGSILLTTFLSITILTMICATSLYITSQNATGGTQTASWHQSLTAAESGVDMAIRAMNTSDWSNWRSASYSSGTTLPTNEPTPSSSATPSGMPDSSHYNFLPSSKCSMTMTTGSEGALSTSAWVTVDQGGMSSAQDTNGKQWYRIRATGQAAVAGPTRASMNKLDNILRNTIALNYNRKNPTSSVKGPTRTIEVVMQPVVTSGWGRGISLRNSINMSGGGVIDSYDSSNAFKSTNGLYDVTKRQSHGDVGTLNSASSDLKSTYVYGSVSYSGTTAVKNTTNVQGAITTPFAASLTNVSDPGWTSGYTAYSGGSPPFSSLNAGTKSHPLLIKVNGNFTVPGGQIVTLVAANSGGDNNYVSIWVTGDYTTSGSGMITQQAGVKATWYIGGDITTSGSSYNNVTGLASAVSMIAYGPAGSKATISGSGAFIGTLNAPNYAVTISGSGSFNGALISDSLLISGGASFHYDEALNTGAGSITVGNYAFASWFEDNSDPSHNFRATDNNLYPIVY